MKGKDIWKAIVFAVIVALAANALGLFYDIGNDVTLLFSDVLARFLITFTAAFVFAVSVGYGRWPGIVTSLAGPVGFTIYYTLAASSLQRSALSAADTGVSLVLNIIILALVYWIVHSSVMKKGGRLLFSAIVALAVLSLHWAWLTVLNLTGAIADLPLSIGTSLTALIFLFILTFFITLLGRSWWPGIIGGIIFGIAGLIAGAAALDGLVRVFVFAVPYILIRTLRGKKK